MNEHLWMCCLGGTASSEDLNARSPTNVTNETPSHTEDHRETVVAGSVGSEQVEGSRKSEQVAGDVTSIAVCGIICRLDLCLSV